MCEFRFETFSSFWKSFARQVRFFGGWILCAKLDRWPKGSIAAGGQSEGSGTSGTWLMRTEKAEGVSDKGPGATVSRDACFTSQPRRARVLEGELRKAVLWPGNA